MSASVVVIDPLSDVRWDEFVSRHPKAGVFHTSAWLDVIQRAFGYLPAHLAYEVDGVLKGVLPLMLIRSALTGKRLVSLPYSGPAGPVGTSEKAVDTLVSAAVQNTHELGCSYLNLQAREKLPPLSESLLISTEPIVCSGVQLHDDVSVTWASLGKAVRREVRKARKLGVSVSIAESVDDLKSFYNLHVKTHRKHGLPPQPYRLFEAMWEKLVPKGMLRLLVASLDGKPIHAAICLSHKNVLSLLYAGTDYRFLRCYPVKLTYWTAIRLACGAGYRHFDFLQSDVDNLGLRWFKRSFGAVEIPVTFYFHPEVVSAVALKNWLARGQSGGARFVRAAMRQVPTVALRILGSMAFKHMG